jgi:hypothetical protein
MQISPKSQCTFFPKKVPTNINIDPYVFRLSSINPINVSESAKLINIFPAIIEDLVIKTIRQAFGNNYDVTVSSITLSKGTNLFQTIEIKFIPEAASSNLNIIISLVYVFDSGKYQVLSAEVSDSTSGDLENPIIRVYTKGSSPQEDGVMYLEIYFPIPNTTYTFSFVLIKNPLDLSEVSVFIQVDQPYQLEININQILSLSQFYSNNSEMEMPEIKIITSTESYFGANLSQSFFEVAKVKMICHHGNYKKKSYTSSDTKYPNLTAVVRGKGCTLIEKVYFISKKTKLDISEFDFYKRLISYSMLRYYLWYLIRGVFDVSILHRDNTRLFFSSLAQSEYALFINIFDDPIIKGYDYYFIKA